MNHLQVNKQSTTKNVPIQFLEPFIKETLEPETEPSVDDPRTNEMRTEIIDSTLPTTGFDTKNVIEYE